MYNNFGVFMVTLPCHKVNTVRGDWHVCTFIFVANHLIILYVDQLH